MATRGGTLHYLTDYATEHLDPQRVYHGRDIANLSRLVYRGLVTFPVTDDPAEASQAGSRHRHRHRHAQRGRQHLGVHHP